ncbi:MAG: DUF922 domain-containing protein [Candidatus Dadabacteria bacterium]|nr:MAG: DUF922 domain-containing protein [Candidatus Dadabacteria bacterium]
MKITVFAVVLAAALCCGIFVCDSSERYKSESYNWSKEVLDNLGFNQVKDLEYKFYDIRGSTAPELRKEMNAKGPLDRYGRRGDAFTGWYLSWRWPYDKNGRPLYNKTRLKKKITVTMPRWSAPADTDPGLLKRWRKFLENVARHEKNHLDFFENSYGKIPGAIKTAYRKNPELTEKEANKIAAGIVEKIRMLDRDYDSRTGHGRTEGISFR